MKYRWICHFSYTFKWFAEHAVQLYLSLKDRVIFQHIKRACRRVKHQLWALEVKYNSIFYWQHYNHNLYIMHFNHKQSWLNVLHFSLFRVVYHWFLFHWYVYLDTTVRHTITIYLTSPFHPVFHVTVPWKCIPNFFHLSVMVIHRRHRVLWVPVQQNDSTFHSEDILRGKTWCEMGLNDSPRWHIVYHVFTKVF